MKEEKTYTCVCGRSFNNIRSLPAHKKKCKVWKLHKAQQEEISKQERESRRLPNGLFKCENPDCTNEHDGSYGSGRFCSKKCARKFSSSNRTIESRKKTSVSVSKLHKHICPKCGKEFMQHGTNMKSLCDSCKNEHIEKCKWCGKEFLVKSYSQRDCCCNSHSQKYHSALKYMKLIELAETDLKKVQLRLKLYRLQCAFTFSLDSYPDEFDFELIEQYGWYKAKNRGNNLNGVSRDHMYSVKDGFINNVDPKIISHPANCRLICHSKNASKGARSCISLDELLSRIEKWNKKYKM